ncbi:hypothetical protein [Campylobacter fetus]|uniref:hypothetical protein n=1 Tax=Campylobacter fetus TaxID=196 RepID=UPI0038656D93|nr:hypothetical protein IXZ22_05825 [Campylobacter fetus subsp. venerealis]WKW23658.1 hypothetical protein IXZ22_04485 [Campylobacter fetus subsp. venerealis]
MQKELLFEKFENDMRKRTRFMRFLLALDQMANVVFGMEAKMKQYLAISGGALRLTKQLFLIRNYVAF